MPNTQILSGFSRHDIVTLLPGDGHFGVELGVAEGVLSERMVASGKFAHYIGIDMYADSHDVQQYKRTLRRIGLTSDYKLLRMRFDEAIDLFDDESLDFIYIDGYAHGGEEGGETIFDWYRKVKVGGVIAGDDYHGDWPLVCAAVDEFADQLGEPILLTDVIEPDSQYSRYPTWAVKKRARISVQAPNALVARGKKELERIAQLREGNLAVRTLKRILPRPVIDWLKSMRGDHA